MTNPFGKGQVFFAELTEMPSATLFVPCPKDTPCFKTLVT